MKILKYIVIISVFSFPLQYLQGIEYRLDDLLRLLQENNLELRIADLDKKIARQEYRLATALDNPEFEYARGSAELFETGSPAQSLWEATLSIRVPNPFFRHFLLKTEKGKLNEAGIRAEIGKRLIVKDFKVLVYHFQYLQTVLKLFKEKLLLLQDIGKIIWERTKLGEVKEIESLRAQVEIQQVKTEIYKIKQRLNTIKIKIQEYLNHTLKPNFKIKEDFKFTPSGELGKNVDSLINTCPVIQLGNTRLKTRKAGVKSARQSVFESFTVFVRRGVEIEAKIWRAGIGIELPLFNFKGAAVKKANLAKLKARQELKQAKNQIKSIISSKIAQIKMLEEEIKTYKYTILKEKTQTITLYESLYNQGEISLLEFLDAQRSFFRVQDNYLRAITEWKIAGAELLEITGGKQ